MSHEDLKQLKDAFKEIFNKHRVLKKMSYLKEGDPEVVEKCSNSLKLLKKFRLKNFYKESTALPFSKILREVQVFLNQILPYYQGHEIELKTHFVWKLLPSEPSPLRQDVLKSFEFCSAMINLYPSSLQQRPITAHIDGYYDFVAPIADNEMRIHLLSQNDDDIPTLPPSITFVSDEKSENDETKRTAPKKFIFEMAPKIGPSTQFHAFMAVIAQTNPLNDLMYMFQHAISADDLSFATTLCVLNPATPYLQNILKVLNILTVDGYLDHFIRCLSCSIRKVVIGKPPTNHIELTALRNIFVASSLHWTSNISTTENNLDKLIQLLCEDLYKNDENLPPLCLYIIKSMLTIGAYDDPCGYTAIAMLLEVMIYPFAKKFDLDQEFEMIKSKLMSRVDTSNDQNSQKLLTRVEKAIVSILGKYVVTPYYPNAVKNELQDLYRFSMSNVERFVQILIVMNARPISEFPPLQSVMFALDKSNEIYSLIQEKKG